MIFPIQRGSSTSGLQAKPGQCPICHKTGVGEPNGFAFVNAGALLAIDKRSAVMDEGIKAFFTIGYHGSHNLESEPSAVLEIARDPPLGQFEFYFCSTACLRAFFNECVSELEKKLKNNG